MSELEWVDRQFKRHWPRLYLDSAELIAIGRGHLPAPFIDELISSIKEHAVVPVISHAHFCDLLKPGDQDAPELLASTLERFWIRGLVDVEPSQIEPWTNGLVDIELVSWGNVRELLDAPAAESNLADHSGLQTAVWLAGVASKHVQRSAAPRPKMQLSQKHEAIVVGAVRALAVGLREDAAAAVDYCAQIISFDLSTNERLGLIERVAPVEASLATLTACSWEVASMTTEHRLKLSATLSAGPDVAPGLWLAKKLEGNRFRNIGRDPAPSDSVDLQHCTYIPYVDIATCDRQAYGAIAPHLEEARGTRRPHLFRNGQLPAVLAHIKRLPTLRQRIEQEVRRELDLSDANGRAT